MKLMSIFPLDSAKCELDMVCQNDWHEKMCITSHSSISVRNKAKINEQNKSIATGSLYVHTKFDTI